MNLQEIYTKLKLTEDSLIRVSADKNWQKKVALPSRIYRLLEKNDLLKTLDAFFCFDNKPLILFFNLENSNRKQELHKAIWNFNESPIAIIVENNAVEIFNGFSIDENTKLLHSIGGVEKLDDFTYFELVTGKTWEKYQKDLSHKNRVDYKLLENIEAAQGLMMNLGLSQTLVNALIGKIIFYRYLIDRKVRLNYQGKERWDNGDLCQCLANKDSFLAFVRHLENKDTGFNGDMFRITPEDYQLISQDALNVLIRLLESEDLMTGQRSLFDLYDFSILPIEFISNMYERFIGVDKQNKESAYYTPTFLVDYIIAETVEKHLSADDNYNCRILDPSCGSGIFLVESLRRIIEKYIKVKNIKSTNTDSFREGIKKLVYDNIFGIDKDYDAIQVAIFSIYLTLLDYQEPADIEKFKFPNLYGKNLICSDTFDVNNEQLKELEEQNLQFDCIIGNPPWKRGGVKRGSYCEKYLKQRGLLNDVGNRELAQAFVLRSMDYTSPNTQCALVLVSKVLYNLDSKKFRSFILNHLYINQVLELAPVRKEVFNKSNDPAVAPACVLFYKNANGESTDSNVINHIALKPSRFFTMFKVFSLTRNDIQEIQQDRLKKYDYLWKVLVYGSYLDFIFIKRLKEHESIHKVVKQNKWSIHQGFKSTDGDTTINTNELFGWNCVENRKMTRYYVPSVFSKWDRQSVGYIFRENGKIATNIYTAPLLLIKDGVPNDLKSVSAICYQNAIYNDSITSISGNEIDLSVLRDIMGVLNSHMFSYFNLMTFSSSGIEREHTHDVEKMSAPYCAGLNEAVEILEQLSDSIAKCTLVDNVLESSLESQIDIVDELICNKLNCSFIEKDLIDYAEKISIPLATKSRGYENVFSVIKSDDVLLKEYAQVYIDRYSNSFNSNRKRFTVDIHYSEQVIGMFFKVIDEKDYTEEILVSKTDNNLLALATKLSSQRITDKLFVQKDIRGFDKEYFYVIKPNEKRLWHKAIAHLDVNEFDDAMLRAGRND